ncbi:MAG: hypothetical protein N2170_00310 [Bacteroidia bacterium]|nr:hypothetical protein [Bacteroidia bacterium]
MSNLLAQDFYQDTLYQRAQKVYFLAVQSERYLPLAETLFHTLIHRYGPQPALQMYTYGITALKARYALNPLKKREYLYQAFAQMDAQVQRTPHDVEVRFLRGSFYYYLPFFLGKRSAAQDDIRTLTRLLLSQPEVYKKRYQEEVLRAIVGFLQRTGWIEEEMIDRLRTVYE